MKSTLLKLFLVGNLLLCAGVLGVSIKTYLDREIVKARTVIHREHIQEVAQNLNYGTQQSWEAEGEAPAGELQLSDPASMDELPTLTQELEALSALAEQRVTQLTAQFEDLTETQGVLEATKTTLAAKVDDLNNTRSRVQNLQTSLSNTKTSLKDTNAQVATLERENSSLQQQVDSLNKQIADQENLISTVEQELALRTTERDQIQAQLSACLRPPVNKDDKKTDWHEKTAKILAVENDWNYVIINKGEVDVLPMFLEAYVHRGDEYIGKIRITQVEHSVAIAEILRETLAPGAKLEAGDTIFF